MQRELLGCVVLLGILPAGAQAQQAITINNYGIYTATVANPQVATPIRQDPNREMSHARFSPDGTRITYTLYNGANGSPANEDYGYENTEIHVCNADGSGDLTVVPAVATALNANSSWVDGNTLVYVSTQAGFPQLRLITISTGALQIINTPNGIFPADPHIIGSLLVYTAVGATQPLRAATITGNQVTNDHALTKPATGQQDYDPRISPDGTKVAFMRFMGGTVWHILTVTVPAHSLGVETDLTPGSVAANGTPDWSSDGVALAYRHINTTGTQAIIDNTQGIWSLTVATDQSSQMALARGVLFNHPSFLPTGNQPPTTIIYCARTYSVALP